MMILQEDIILPVAEFKDCLLKKLVEMEVNATNSKEYSRVT